MPRARRARPQRVTRATLAALAESITAERDADPTNGRAPITPGTVGTVATTRSPAARKRSKRVKGGSADATVRVRRADGTVDVYRPAIDPDRRKASRDTDPGPHPLRGTIGQHPVTGAPVARPGHPTTTGLGDYDTSPVERPVTLAQHDALRIIAAIDARRDAANAPR